MKRFFSSNFDPKGANFQHCLQYVNNLLDTGKYEVGTLDVNPDPVNPTVYKMMKEKNKVADNSPFNVNLMCSYFAKIGVEVVATANNGGEALKKYDHFREKRVKIDIVTLDVEIPKVTGNFVLKKIRKYEENNRISRTKIAMISGNYEERQVTNPNSEERWKVDFFFKKPLLFEEFMTAAYEILLQA